MYLFACLLDGFYAAATPNPEGGPLVVQRDKRVLDANPLARSRGIGVGMPLAEARSILNDDGQIVEWTEEPYREASRRWLEVVAQYADAVEPLKQHEVLADLTGHPRPREAAASLERALVRAGFAPRCSVGGCRWVARLAARRGDPLGLAHSDPASYVGEVRLDALPLSPDEARRLSLLGYRTAADLAALSVDTLRAQFGDRAHGIAAAALGRGDAQVRAVFPADSVAARFTYESPPDTRQALDLGLLGLASEIGRALREADASGRTVELFLESEDGDVASIARTFARSVACEGDVANALGLMLPGSPSKRIASVRARLPGVETNRRVQLDMHGGRSRADRAESVRAALGHVREAYGEHSVRLVSEIREPRWVRVRRAYRQLNGWAW